MINDDGVGKENMANERNQMEPTPPPSLVCITKEIFYIF